MNYKIIVGLIVLFFFGYVVGYIKATKDFKKHIQCKGKN